MKKAASSYLIGFLTLAAVCFLPPVLAQEPNVPRDDLGEVLKDFSKLSGGERNLILESTGLPQADDFNLAKIFAYILFSGVGFVAFVYGKKNVSWRPMVIGITLMVYPYMVSGIIALYFVGIVLVALLYFWRD